MIAHSYSFTSNNYKRTQLCNESHAFLAYRDKPFISKYEFSDIFFNFYEQ
jgi:hypothetical protein